MLEMIYAYMKYLYTTEYELQQPVLNTSYKNNEEWEILRDDSGDIKK